MINSDITRSRVIEINKNGVEYRETEAIYFDSGATLSAIHETNCCEAHYLGTADLELSDFEGLEFDLSGDAYFEKVPGSGIRLVPVVGHPVFIPGYSDNNGYYSDELELVLWFPDKKEIRYDITDCQEDIYND